MTNQSLSVPPSVLLQANKKSSPSLPLRVFASPLQFKEPYSLLLFASPLMVSALFEPIRFSKFVALAVDNERVAPPVLEVSAKLKVSSPVPPSNVEMLALARVCARPLLSAKITDTVSLPDPIFTESPFASTPELIVSLPSPRLIVRSPPINEAELPLPGSLGILRFNVSAKPLPVMVQLSVLLYIAIRPG